MSKIKIVYLVFSNTDEFMRVCETQESANAYIQKYLKPTCESDYYVLVAEVG